MAISYHLYFNKNGLTLEVTKQLINSYFISSKQDIDLIESFPDSPLGDFNAAPIIFDYLKNHPWLQFYLPDQTKTVSQQTNYPSDLMDDLAHDLYRSTGPFQKQALIHFFTLVNSQNFEYLQPLIPNYIPDFYYQMEANRWAASPKNQIVCDHDIDNDQENECVITNQSYFLVYELTGGYVPFIAAKGDNNSFFQFSGSSSQLIFGLSPSQEWQMGNSIFLDPSVIPGIIIEPNSLKQVGSISADQTQLFLSDFNKPDNTLLITLLDKQITLDYAVSQSHSNISIPFFCQYDLQLVNLPVLDTLEEVQTLRLTCAENPLLFFISGQQVESAHYSIHDINIQLQNPENPDFEYPRAHYLPLGLSQTYISFESKIKLTFVIP